MAAWIRLRRSTRWRALVSAFGMDRPFFVFEGSRLAQSRLMPAASKSAAVLDARVALLEWRKRIPADRYRDRDIAFHTVARMEDQKTRVAFAVHSERAGSPGNSE